MKRKAKQGQLSKRRSSEPRGRARGLNSHRDPNRTVRAGRGRSAKGERLKDKEGGTGGRTRRFELAEIHADFIWEVSREGKITSVRIGSGGATGYTPQELLGRSLSEFQPPEEAARMARYFARAGAQAGTITALETLFRTKDQKLVPMEWTVQPLLDRDGNVRGFRGLGRETIERKGVEEALRESEASLRDSEATLRTFINALPDPALLLDRDLKALAVNEALARRLGQSSQALIGKAITSMLPHEVAEQRASLIREAVRTGRAVHFEDMRELHHYLNHVSPIKDSSGEVSRIAIFALDITERKQAEERMRQMALMLDLAPSSIIVHTPEGRILYANQNACELHGYSPDEFLAINLHQLSLPESEKLIPSRVQEIRERQMASFEVVHHKKDGTALPLAVYDRVVDWDGQEAILSIGSDITERRRAEQALRESNERFQAAFFLSPSCVSISRAADGVILDINQSVLDVSGYTREELIGQSSLTLNVWADTEVRERLRGGLAESKEVRGLETSLRRKDGVPVTVSISARMITAGGEERLLMFADDITERKQHEQELEAIATLSAALRTAETLAEMVPILVDQLMGLLLADGAALVLRDPPSGETVCELGRGELAATTGVRLAPNEGVSGQVIQSGKLYVTGDVHQDHRVVRPEFFEGIRAAACVPLIARGETIGALWAGRQNAFAPHEIRLLSAIADIAANAIRRTTLHEQTERRLQHLIALSDIDRTISSSFDLRLTLAALLIHVTAELEVDAADVLLFNPVQQRLEYAAGRGFRTKAIERVRLRLGEGYAGRVALHRELLQVRDLREPPEESSLVLESAEEGFVCYFGVPLITKGEVKGVLEVHQRTPCLPDQEWLDLLKSLAESAAIAVENSTLFDGLQRSTSELTVAYDATIEGWSRALDLRDKETEGHTQRVTDATLRLARVLNLSEEELVQVRWGALLHDIGKMGVPDRILLKPGPLGEEEWAVMKMHPTLAYELLSPIHYLRAALEIPYCHHERWDGTGYPRGLRAEQIPLAARIFSVVDVWDALNSDRPYRKAWPPEKVREHLISGSGSQFDPQVVRAFLETEVPAAETSS